ncbi:MAG TPA: stage II sporulation protein R [Candidatus Faecimonas gallistercoris]|nr:stage II sporulation protein R [Candidatus Faecimonas gallistercoris]
MKKLVVILAIVVTILAINKEEKIVIPKEAIRFRVIANSNEEKDQSLKKKVVNNLNGEIRKLTVLDNNLENSRKNIKNQIPEFSKVVKETLDKNQSNQIFTIDYGMNYFPEKEYKGIVYEEGEYESLVITLGNGQGENFWCVLFPPLCLLDSEEEVKDVEYTSLVKELVDKYF